MALYKCDYYLLFLLYVDVYCIDESCYVMFSADFFQLLFVCLQWKVFSVEKYEESDEEGGCNRSVIPSIQKENPDPNPREDFITYKEYVIYYSDSGVHDCAKHLSN